MSLADEVARLLPQGLITGYMGVVTSVSTAGAKVDVRGAVLDVSISAGYTPAVGDNVLVMRVGDANSWVAAFKISATGEPRGVVGDGGIDFAPLALGNTTSSAFVNMPGAPLFTFTKKYGADKTKLRVLMVTGAYASALAPIRWGVYIRDANLAGADYETVGTFFNAANSHLPASGARRIYGLPAGTYTVFARWRSPSAVQINVDQNDFLSIVMEEVAL